MAEEYGRWPESRWKSPDINWKKAGVVTAGVDIGAVSSQAVVMCDGAVYSYSNQRCGPNGVENASKAMDRALEGTGMNLKRHSKYYCYRLRPLRSKVRRGRAKRDGLSRQRRPFYVRTECKDGLRSGRADQQSHETLEWDRIAELAINDKCAVSMGWGIEILADLMHVPAHVKWVRNHWP